MMRYCIFMLLLCCSQWLTAQSYKDKCVAGNCRNGFGLLRVQSNKDPLPQLQGTFNTVFHYYVMGEFKSGKLNGKGCRFEVPWNFGNFKPFDEKYGQLVQEQQLPLPDSTRFNWFETGTYQEGELNGPGYCINYKYDNGLNTVYYSRQGEFKNGKLQGNGVKIITRFSSAGFYDLLRKQYEQQQRPIQTIIHGTFVNDGCTSCTKSTVSTTGVWGNITGEKLDDEFFSGWVLKDYTDSAAKGNVSPGFHFIQQPAFLTLYVGGIALDKEFPAEQAAVKNKINLGDGRIYEGETDAAGRPYGFGEITDPAYYYKGFVNQGVPDGYGVYYRSPIGSLILGGRFENGQLLNGVSYMSGGWPKTTRCYGYTKNTSPPGFNLFTGAVENGDYEEKTYSYNVNTRMYAISKQSNGYMFNGQTGEQYVSVGKTNADIKRQRTVKNGTIAFNDVVPGDVVVLNGLASPVVSNKDMRITLLDGRYISNTFQNSGIQLSKHPAESFEHSCSNCKGKLYTTSTYTPPPQQVTLTRYVKETVVGDFTIWTKYVPVTTTYTKTFAPVTRKEFCTLCNGTGRQVKAAQLKE